jgi:predicted AlkP superfamily pyrophosphatase or phosphodiesterase
LKPTVILTAIDGLRAPALAEVDCPNIESLKHRGAYTLRASSVMPSITLPCFLSIFHSIPPSRHGTMHNTFIPMLKPVPGLVEVARSQGKRCAFFHNWEPLRDLNDPLHLSFSLFMDSLNDGRDCDHALLRQAIGQMQQLTWDLVFIYMGSLDVAGHAHGFMSSQYLQQLSHLDTAVGLLLERMPAESHLMLVSDHGGHARTHGTDSPDDMIIPFFLSGPQIHRGFEIQSEISLLDIAPTLARLLDITPHPEWEGSPVDSAFIDRR